MPIETTQRHVTAPVKEWLTEGEVLVALGDISSRTLERHIAAGRFPSSILWGRDARWLWKDVAWFWLAKELAARLKGQEDDEEPSQERQPPANRRQTAT